MPPQAPGEQNTVDAVDAGNAANDSHNPSVSLHPASLQDLPAPERRLSIAHDSIKTGMPSDTEPGGMTDPPDGAAQQTIPSALDAHAHAGAKLLAPSAADCSAVNPAPPAATDQSGADAPALPKPFMTPAETTTPHGSPAPSPALSRGPSPAPSFAPSPVAASPASPALKSHKLPGGSPLLSRSADCLSRCYTACFLSIFFVTISRCYHENPSNQALSSCPSSLITSLSVPWRGC